MSQSLEQVEPGTQREGVIPALEQYPQPLNGPSFLLREALDDPFSWATLEGARGLREVGDRDSLLELIDSGSTLARMAEEVLMEES